MHLIPNLQKLKTQIHRLLYSNMDMLLHMRNEGEKYNIIHPKPDGKTYPTSIKNIMKIRKIETKNFKTSWKNKDIFLKRVKSGKENIDTICIACPSLQSNLKKK